MARNNQLNAAATREVADSTEFIFFGSLRCARRVDRLRVGGGWFFLGWLGGLALALAAFAFSSIPAIAAPFFLANLPDFYQHQKSGAGWNVAKDADITFKSEAPLPGSRLPDGTIAPGTVPSYALSPKWWEDGGWCCVESLTDVFYYVEKTLGFQGFFTRAAEPAGVDWLKRMVYATEDLARRFHNLRTAAERDADLTIGQTIPVYVRSLEQQSRELIAKGGGAAKSPLRYSEYDVSEGKVFRLDYDRSGRDSVELDMSATYRTLYDALRDELCRGAGVQIRLEGPSDKNVWWQPTYHYVAAAGVEDCNDPAKLGLWFADPDKRNEFDGNVYTALDVRQPYLDANLPLPIGELFYENVSIAADRIVDTDPLPDSYSLYAGARITQLRVLASIPEPSVLALFGIGLIVLYASRRRMRNA